MKVVFNPLRDPKEVAEVYRDLGNALRDSRSVFRALLPTLARESVRGIETQGASIGASWAPLKPDTIKRKMRSGHRSALIQTGRLLASLSREAVGNRALTMNRLSYGPPPSIRQAAAQQFGSKRGVPARPYLGWSNTSRSELIRLQQEHIARVIKEAEDKLR